MKGIMLIINVKEKELRSIGEAQNMKVSGKLIKGMVRVKLHVIMAINM